MGNATPELKEKADYVTGKYMQSEKVKEYEIRISTSPKFKNAKKIKMYWKKVLKIKRTQ